MRSLLILCFFGIFYSSVIDSNPSPVQHVRGWISLKCVPFVLTKKVKMRNSGSNYKSYHLMRHFQYIPENIVSQAVYNQDFTLSLPENVVLQAPSSLGISIRRSC